MIGTRSNVNNMRSMFKGVKRFNGDITSWNTSNVIDMSFMFDNANDFNQNITDWSVCDNLVGNVMFMFEGATTWLNNYERIDGEENNFDGPVNDWKLKDRDGSLLLGKTTNLLLSEKIRFSDFIQYGCDYNSSEDYSYTFTSPSNTDIIIDGTYETEYSHDLLTIIDNTTNKETLLLGSGTLSNLNNTTNDNRVSNNVTIMFTSNSPNTKPKWDFNISVTNKTS